MLHFFLRLGAGGAVIVARVGVVFQKRIFPDHFLEAFSGHEVVVYPVRLPGPGRAGGGGDGEFQIVPAGHHLF